MEKTEDNNTMSNKKKLLAGGAALSLGAGALFVGATTASWNDSETIFAEFTSDSFGIEISIDGESWTSGTADEDNQISAVELPFTGGDFSMGETQTDTFHIRVSDENPEASAVLWLSDINGMGDSEGFSYEISGDTENDLIASGSTLNSIDQDEFVTVGAGEEIKVNVEVEGNTDLIENAEAEVLWEVTAQEENAFEANVEVQE